MFFILSLIILSCNNETKDNQIPMSDNIGNIDTIFICDIKENIDVIQDINDVAFLNDSTFFIISNKQLIKYNSNGEQMQIYNHIGSGPHEYITPSLMQINDSSIFVWCNTSLKLIEFDTNGKPRKEITNYRKAIKNFSVYENKYIFFYKSDVAEPGVIDVYDIKEDRVIKSVGTFSEEDIILLLLASKPEIIIHYNYVYFVKPSSLKIFRFNIENFNLETVSDINDTDFSVTKVEEAVNIINTQRNKAFEYLQKNSITDNIFLVNDGLIIKSEVGIYELNEKEKRIERDKRFNKFYFHPFSKIDSDNYGLVWKTKSNPNLYNYINYNSNIFIIKNSLNNEVENSKLYKIQFKT